MKREKREDKEKEDKGEGDMGREIREGRAMEGEGEDVVWPQSVE